MSFNSSIDTRLPTMPRTREAELLKELTLVYDAIRILQVELSDLKARVKVLDNK